MPDSEKPADGAARPRDGQGGRAGRPSDPSQARPRPTAKSAPQEKPEKQAAEPKETDVISANSSTYVNRIDRFLQLMNDRGASDLHFSVGHPPLLRLHGQVDPIRYRRLTDGDYEAYIREITPPKLWKRFVETGDLDFAHEVPGLARFRVNLFRQVHGNTAVFRIIPSEILTIDQLGLPEVAYKLTQFERGLVLVTGPTGSGKSTSLSAIINEMNANRALHIITIEDPIEFVHPVKRSLITQREIGSHATNFTEALKAAMREDPDVVLVGEMRDLETMALALAAAETGLLVFGTMHTNSAAKAIDRLLNAFPTDEQEGVRSVLSDTLKAVLAQQLLRRKGGGRIAALEVLLGSPALGSLIREGKTHQIANVIAMGKKKGMIAMDDALFNMLAADKVDPEAAYEKAIEKKSFRKKIKVELGIVIEAGDDEDDE
jgi:twitching motility protein PilT